MVYCSDQTNIWVLEMSMKIDVYSYRRALILLRNCVGVVGQ
jgi:hypothetical protein